MDLVELQQLFLQLLELGNVREDDRRADRASSAVHQGVHLDVEHPMVRSYSLPHHVFLRYRAALAHGLVDQGPKLHRPIRHLQVLQGPST